MSENILQKIINNRIKEIEKRKSMFSIEKYEENIIEYEHMYGGKYYNFKDKILNNIKNNKISIIGEIKKASPSAGVLIKDYYPQDIAKIYKNKNITCLSVLTEEEHFLGDMQDIFLCKVTDTGLPILCKDFFVDKYQIYWARSKGADAILIILAGISDKLADELYDEAVAIVAKEGKASTSLIQRRLQIGYNRAARIIEQMEVQEVIGKADRVGRREVLVGSH